MNRELVLGSTALAMLFATGCQTFAQHRAALVPHATPLPGNGQPLASAGELSLGASNALDLKKPGVGDPDAGVAIPRHQIRSSIAVRATKNFSLGAVYERGLEAGATRVKSSEPPVDNGDVSGVGVNLAYSIPTGDDHWRIGIQTEVLAWSVPWVQYTNCIMNCSGPRYSYVDRGESTVPTLAIGLTPSYRSGPFTVFGGITARNHPTITEKLVTNVPTDPDVRAGQYNATLHAGLDLELGAGVRAGLIIHQTVTSDPVSYGPGVGLLVIIPLGRDVTPPVVAPASSGPPGALL